MASNTQETERKYEAPTEVELPDPGRLFGLGAGSQDDVELDATYFDTADLRLARAGVTLRRRVGGDDAGWHLKLPIDAESRHELQLPLGRSTSQPPPRFVAMTRVHTRGASLGPVAKLLTRRRRWTLTSEGGAQQAELAEDRVHGIRLSPPTDELDWRELEIELLGDGSRQLLDAMEAELRALGVRRSAAPSKLSRVLGNRLPSPVEPDTPGKRSTAGAVVLAYLREQAAILRSYDPLVRMDATDAVHKMRVTARRIRSGLQGYRRVLDRDATRELVEDLRWLGAELAPARDSEVLAARITDAIHALPAEQVLGPVAAQVTRRFAREQADGRDRLTVALDSQRYLRLQERLDTLLDDPPSTRRARRRAKSELPKAITKSLRRTGHRAPADDAAHNAAADPERDTALHEMRKAAKRARYVIEAAEPVLGNKARKLRKRVKTVRRCSVTTTTPSSLARCCATSAPRHSLTGPTGSPSACCTPNSTPRPVPSKLNCPRRGRRSQRRAGAENPWPACSTAGSAGRVLRG
jgi:inorganic triphosphatase YgiF